MLLIFKSYNFDKINHDTKKSNTFTVLKITLYFELQIIVFTSQLD